MFNKTELVDHIVEKVSIKKIILDQNQTNPNFRLMPHPIQNLEMKIIQIIDLETLLTIDKKIIPTTGIETIQTIETLDIKLIDHAIILTTGQNIKIIKINHAIIHRTENQSYNNRQRNYSQSPHWNNTHYQNSQQNYRSSTPKHQRQMNQVQSTEQTQPDPPGIHNNKSTELQLNHINCESTDYESDTKNTV